MSKKSKRSGQPTETQTNTTEKETTMNENANIAEETVDNNNEETNMETKSVGLEEALEKCKTLPQQFKVKCSKCGGVKAVRSDVFTKRVEKVYSLGGDLNSLITGYICAHCRKVEGLNVIGGKKISGGSGKVITIEDFGI
jgi:hypothetical protein